MKNKLFVGLLGVAIMYSCSQKCTQEKGVELIANKQIKSVIDSVITLNNNQNVYELFIHKIEGYRGFMLLHIGTESYYNKKILSLSYFISNNHKVKIYSGVESYFNRPNEDVTYGRTEGIYENKDHLLWGIYMYKDSVIGVYSIDFANPFLLIPSPPPLDLDEIIK